LRGTSSGDLPNSTETSVQGNNDTASLEKDIITMVHVTYDLK
jgi:hypothetical protein